MARSVDEIKQAMVDQKDAESGLSGLTSTSLTAIFNLLFFICATSIKVIEDLFDVLKEDVEERRLEIPVGVLPWYASESLLFQFGDTLIFTNTFVNLEGIIVILNGSIVTYAVLDDTNRIVKLAAADIENGLVTIKAAGLDGSGVAKKLEDIEAGSLAAFTDYWITKRFAGTAITIVSIDPDLLKAEYTITYDQQILAADGSLLSDSGTFPVEDAVDTFLQQFQGENFAGSMQVMRLTDAIQLAQGVLNAVATNIEARPDGGVFIDVLVVTNQTYNSRAGYMKIDTGFPLSTTLTYVSS